MSSTTKPANLDELCTALNRGDCDESELPDLPTFGGEDIVNTAQGYGVWSWDEGRAIVGGNDGFEIIDRTGLRP